jgi:hypothetical protein
MGDSGLAWSSASAEDRLRKLKTRMNHTPEFGIGWGTLALINAGLAQAKNRSGLNWFLLSLLLGPIATFLLVAFCERLPSDR